MSSSSSRPSSNSSSTASISDKAPEEPGLAQLVNYFVSSKRSLASIEHVWRANEIVNTARQCLEENAVLLAKNVYIRRAIDEQVVGLEAVRLGVETVGTEGKEDYR
ncbi:hypothetical protein LTS18_012176, partial [Coniosporium uncinatum]